MISRIASESWFRRRKNPEAYVTLRHRHAQRPPESCIYLGAYYLNLQHGIGR